MISEYIGLGKNNRVWYEEENFALIEVLRELQNTGSIKLTMRLNRDIF